MLENCIKKVGSTIICVTMLASMAACQKNPDSSLVVNKDLDKLIEDAQNSDTGKVNIDEIIEQNYDSYITTIKNDDLGVTVNVNAKVDIPQTEKLSIFRVEQKSFSGELIDKIRKELLGDTKLYHGGVLSVKTKKDIEDKVSWLRSQMEGPDVTEGYRSECQEKIDALQKEYESTPSSIDFTPYISDGKLTTYDKMLSKYIGNEYYEWVEMMNPDGDFVYEISDGSDGNYSMFYVQNNPDKSNKLIFRTNSVHYESHGGVMVGETSLTTDTTWESYPQNYLTKAEYFEEPTLTPVAGDVSDTSLEDAIETANDFLETVGIDGFKYYEGGLYSEQIRMDHNTDGTYYGTYYILRYYRSIEGAFLTQSSGTNSDPGDGYGETKLSWAGESIEFRINDNGIVGFDFNAPLNIVETVVNNSSLKSFEDIKITFEKMMPITKASEYYTKAYDVDRVRLSYSRISEVDSFDTGLIVPVWDFLGSYENVEDRYIAGNGYGSLLAINAIDGSIIDPDLGY
ncbi:MAG: hypothetical protein IJ499_06970 [Clostridia bacterium]|nr:hypothetical protein [Clostridia bacterium]